MELFNNPFPNNAYNNAELQELQAKLELVLLVNYKTLLIAQIKIK